MVVGDIATGTEVLVIGAGPGGYVAAIRAAQKGLDTTLVEKDAYGGACLNRGCIPSKALITGSGLAHEAGNAESMGIHADPAVDMGKMVEWKDGVVDRLTGGVEKLCKANGVNLVPGTASFVDEHTARVAHGGQGQGSESIEFEHAIIATGSRPIQIPGFEFAEDHVWSSADALDADTVPDRLGIVGGGYIGMELATTYAKLGADVTVVEMLDDILDPYEDDVKRIVRKRAEAGRRVPLWRGRERVVGGRRRRLPPPHGDRGGRGVDVRRRQDPRRRRPPACHRRTRRRQCRDRDGRPRLHRDGRPHPHRGRAHSRRRRRRGGRPDARARGLERGSSLPR